MTPCIIAPNKKSPDGYHRLSFRVNGKRIRWLAHRYAYVMVYGPTDKLILHKCNNKECWNPDHLKPGTTQENALDAIKVGNWRRCYDETHIRGNGRCRTCDCKRVAKKRELEKNPPPNEVTA